MIANQTQYGVTQDRIRRFSEALVELDSLDSSWLVEVEARDIRDQIDELENAIATYDRLVSGEVQDITVDRIADLPQALVEARIAAGLSQQELANLSGQSSMKIRQWERDGYSRAPVNVMRSIAAVLPLTLRGRAGVSAPPRPSVRSAIVRAGLPREVYDDVIVPSGYGDAAHDDEVDRRLGRLFGIGAMEFAGGRSFEPSPLRFKLPANAALERTRAYAAYVDGLCSIVAKTQSRVASPLPTLWSQMRELLFPTGEVDLMIALRQCWSLGIGVVGLRDKVAFHGACRRQDGLATIVLKPSSGHASRWLFNLIHEIFHLVSESGDFTLVEGDETSRDRRKAQNELRADRFAAMVLTNGTLREASAMVAERSRGNGARLVSAVRETATHFDIPVGVLANLVAENVKAASNINWWGAAQNLQPPGDDPWKIVRDVFLDEADFGVLGSTESAILWQILETSDE